MDGIRPDAARAGESRRATVAALSAVAYLGAAAPALLTKVVVGFPLIAWWIPAGVALVAAFTYGTWVLPGVFAGAFVSYSLLDVPLTGALIGASTATLQAAAGAWLLCRLRVFQDPRHLTTRDVTLFGMVALAVVAPTGLLFNLISPMPAPADAQPAMSVITWVLADFTGIVLLTPLGLAVLRGAMPTVDPRRAFEGGALIAVVAVGMVSVYSGLLPDAAVPVAATALFVPVLWSAFRFDRRMMAVILVEGAAVAIWGALSGLAPMSGDDLHITVMVTQLMVSAAAYSAFTILAVVSERRSALQALEAAAATLERRVGERTTQLTTVNRRLEESIARARGSERAAEEANRRLRDIVEEVPVGLVFIDPEGRVIQSNRAAQRLFGMSAQGLEELDAERLMATRRGDAEPEADGTSRAVFARPDGATFPARYRWHSTLNGTRLETVLLIEQIAADRAQARSTTLG